MKILLVDDAAFIRMSMKKILDASEFDFDYLEAADGEEALEIYKAYIPDLVIMDITMPKMDGIAAVKAIREVNPAAKIIMCSSMGYQEKVFDAISAGAQDFIVKPYNPEKVLNSIRVVMGS